MTQQAGRRPAAIVGVGMSDFQTRRDDVDFLSLYQEGAAATLDDAGLAMEDIDLIVLAQAPDALHGVGHPEQSAAGPLAVHGTPVLRVNTGGATGASAVQMGWWAVASGRADAVLVLGVEKMGDATRGAQEVLNKIWDSRYESLMPLNTLTMCAMSSTRYMDQYGAQPEHFASIASRLRNNGTRNPKAHLRTAVTPEEVLESPVLTWPIHRFMSCPRSTGAAGVVVASGDLAGRLSAPSAWIRGIAARTNTYFMGDKMGDCGPNDHGTYHDLQLATDAAYEMAGIREPAREVDVVEPYVPFAVMEPAMLEAMRLCEPGEAPKLEEQGHWAADGACPVSPSGGVLCANPISVSAMIRVAEAAQQVRGRAGDHQVPGASTAVGTGTGGSVQFFVSAVLEADAEAA